MAVSRVGVEGEGVVHALDACEAIGDELVGVLNGLLDAVDGGPGGLVGGGVLAGDRSVDWGEFH